MPKISRQEFAVGTQVVRTIQSITFRRRCDKFVKRCINCNTEIATIKGKKFCRNCNSIVDTYDIKKANKGDIVSLQFIPKIPQKTVNFEVAGGFFANAKSKAEAEKIKKKHGLIQCLKMGEQMPDNTNVDDARNMIASGDLRAVPRCFGVNDVITWKAEGETYEIV